MHVFLYVCLHCVTPMHYVMCRTPVQLQLGEWGTQVEGECNSNFIMTFDRSVTQLHNYNYCRNYGL